MVLTRYDIPESAQVKQSSGGISVLTTTGLQTDVLARHYFVLKGTSYSHIATLNVHYCAINS